MEVFVSTSMVTPVTVHTCFVVSNCDVESAEEVVGGTGVAVTTAAAADAAGATTAASADDSTRLNSGEVDQR